MIRSGIDTEIMFVFGNINSNKVYGHREMKKSNRFPI